MTSQPENSVRDSAPGQDDGGAPLLGIPDPGAGEPAAADPDSLPGPLADPVDGPLADPVDGPLADPVDGPVGGPRADPVDGPVGGPRADPVDDAADGTAIPVAALAGQQWPGILAMFVDDPRGAVERACAAAQEQAAALTAALEREQAALRSSWPDDAGTEDLRTTLQQYRSLCSKIASVTP